MLIWFELKSILVPDKVCLCVCVGGGGEGEEKARRGEKEEKRKALNHSLYYS